MLDDEWSQLLTSAVAAINTDAENIHFIWRSGSSILSVASRTASQSGVETSDIASETDVVWGWLNLIYP